MPQIGDDVVLMSSPGRFRVIAVDGDTLTIENDQGLRKLVFATSVRSIPKATQK